jgi:hypothetical protein
VLSELPQLEHLDLQKACDFGDVQLAAAGPALTRLSSLDLRGTWVTPRGLAGLSSVTSLKRLALSVVPQPPGSEGYAVLSKLQQLRGLCCQGEELGGALMGALVQLPDLRVSWLVGGDNSVSGGTGGVWGGQDTPTTWLNTRPRI